MNNPEVMELLKHADALHQRFGASVHDKVSESTYKLAREVASANVSHDGRQRFDWELRLDRLITSKFFGAILMVALLVGIFWITITGANVPSAFLAGILIEEGGLSNWLHQYLGVEQVPWLLSMSLYEWLHLGFSAVHAPAWLTGFLLDGMYLALAWVVAVMLPPMAIFFPLFTLAEDLGLLARIAFNLDGLLRAAGAHGKQALTMAMGFGCNAAGVISCRIIDSPRERLIAIVTNNFVPCNGRWPTLIMVSSLFVAAGFSGAGAVLVAASAVTVVTLIGVVVTLIVSWVLSRTLLKGVASSFTLELPPYRRPQIARVLWTSMIDRTLYVLWRAIICAAPAGALIWLLGAISVGDQSLFVVLRGFLDPLGHLIGLDGVIVIAFIFAIPANEIVVPTIIMGYMQTTKLTEIADPTALFTDNGWTLVTAICLLLFSLLHYPCPTPT
ncbi:MAG: ferrous iron transporter B, partial [Candidatus Hydrogenedentes bacterium]|nr:ferrous iron transporter B [Candidatus Hydrogenedentota bacterium]